LAAIAQVVPVRKHRRFHEPGVQLQTTNTEWIFAIVSRTGSEAPQNELTAIRARNWTLIHDGKRVEQSKADALVVALCPRRHCSDAR
jgi:hypothetical protein